MGGKHPQPGHVFIVSQHNGYLLAKNDDDCIITTTNKEARGESGWRISNVPNNENIGCMGFNLIFHNKHPSKLLACNDNGKLIVSELRKWDSWSGWRILQQKDTNIYQLTCHNGYWLTINDNGDIIMLKKDQLINDKKQNWCFEYISTEEMKRKVPMIQIIQSQVNEEEEIITNKKQIKQKRNKKQKISYIQQNSDDDGYDVDIGDEDEDDEKKINNVIPKQMKKQQVTTNVYDKKEMDKKFELLSETLTSSLKELSKSIRSIRSEITSLKIDIKTMEEKAQIDRGRIKEKLDILQKSIQNNNRMDNIGNNNRNNMIHQNRKELKNWITNIVGFGGYYNTFIKNGFDSLKIIQQINDPQQLDDIGIKLKGHQLQIMAEILQLKNRNSQCQYV